MSGFVRRLASYFWYYGTSDSWRVIYSLLEMKNGMVFLDAGCGDGSSTILIAYCEMSAGKSGLNFG